MNRQVKLPIHYLSLLLLSTLMSGCYYIGPSALNAYYYAPKTPATLWTSPKKMNLASTTKQDTSVHPKTVALPAKGDPLSLGEIIDVALQNNPTTMQTWAQARQAAAQFGLSQSSAFPTIDLNAMYSRSREGVAYSNVIQPYYLTQFGPQATISYTVFDFGQQRASSDSARHALYYANLTHNRQIQTVIQNVTISFYNYLYQKHLLKAYQSDVETAKTTLDATKVDLEAGIKNISDFLQAKTQLLLSETNFSNQQQQVTTSLAALYQNMGIGADSHYEFLEPPLDVPALLDMRALEDLISMAEKDRSDLLAAEQNVESAQRALTAAVRADSPTITYDLQVGRTYYGAQLNDGHNFVSTLTLNVPFFQGFYYENSIRSAQAQKEAAEAALRQAKLQVLVDVTTSHEAVRVAYNTLKLSKEYLESSNEQYTVALAQYKMGTSTILDVVSAQNLLANARATYASAVNQWLSSLATLNYSVGALNTNILPPGTSGVLCSEK